jgi:hypothetical protein
MPKHLITVIGLIVALGIVALAVVLIALPMWVQSLGVDTQTTTVENTNQLYQSQVDALEAEQERLGEIEASVAALREEIPAVNQLDDVFEVIGGAAEDAGVTLTSATAGPSVPFVARTTPSDPADAAPVEAPPADTNESAQAQSDAGEGGEAPAPAEGGASDAASGAPAEGDALQGRQQIDFEIMITANEMDQVTAFLDALRAGPRLLSSVTATATQTGTAIEVQITALTFVDSKGGA